MLNEETLNKELKNQEVCIPLGGPLKDLITRSWLTSNAPVEPTHLRVVVTCVKIESDGLYLSVSDNKTEIILEEKCSSK